MQIARIVVVFFKCLTENEMVVMQREDCSGSIERSVL